MLPREWPHVDHTYLRLTTAAANTTTAAATATTATTATAAATTTTTTIAIANAIAVTTTNTARTFLLTPGGCAVGVLAVVLTFNTLVYVAVGPCFFARLTTVSEWPQGLLEQRSCSKSNFKNNIGGLDTEGETRAAWRRDA